MNILIAFHSIYGHTYTLAQNIKSGAEKISGANIKLCRIKEILPPEIIKEMGAAEILKSFEHLPVATADDMVWADCIILGCPTYFGKVSSQMAFFMDSTSTLYGTHSLKNKIGGAFTSTGCQNGGGEETLRAIQTYFLHQSMIPVGIDISDKNLERNDKVLGTCCYGVSCVAGEDYNSKEVTEEEKKFASDFGERLASITKKFTE